MPPKLKKDGTVDKRSLNKTGVAHARNKLREYVAKGKYLRGKHDDEYAIGLSDLDDDEVSVDSEEVVEVTEKEEPKPEPKATKATPQEPELEGGKTEDSEDVKPTENKQTDKPKLRRRARKIEIEIDDSSSESDSEDFQKYVKSYKTRRRRKKEDEINQLEQMSSIFERMHAIKEQPQPPPPKPKPKLDHLTNMSDFMRMSILKF
jgi:hypothetical protein